MSTAITISDARPRVDLAQAARQLADICDVIDDHPEQLDEALLAQFNFAKLQTQIGVKEAIEFRTFCEGAITAAKQARDAWSLRYKQIEAVLERFKARLTETIAASPDLPYTSPIGKLGVQKNPPSLETVWGDRTLTEEDINFFGIDSEFYETVVTYKLRTDHVKNYLKGGNDLPWASLKQTEGVRFRK